MAGWIKMPLGRDIGLNPSNIVLDGDPAHPFPKKGAEPPQFRAMSIVAKRLDGSRRHLAWMDVGLSPGHTVVDGDPAPRKKRTAHPPIFSHVYCGQTSGWIKMPHGTDATCYEGTTSAQATCYMMTQHPAPQKRGPGPQFLAHVYWGQTVAHLSYC